MNHNDQTTNAGIIIGTGLYKATSMYTGLSQIVANPESRDTGMHRDDNRVFLRDLLHCNFCYDIMRPALSEHKTDRRQ